MERALAAALVLTCLTASAVVRTGNNSLEAKLTRRFLTVATYVASYSYLIADATGYCWFFVT